MSRPPVDESGEIALPGGTVRFTVRRSARRWKTIEMRVDPEAGVLIAAPVATPAKEIEAFMLKRAAWISARMAAAALSPAPVASGPGDRLAYLGRDIPIDVREVPAQRVSVAFREDTFLVSVPGWLDGDARQNAIREAFTGWFHTQAAAVIPELVSRWAPLVGGGLPRAVRVRDQKRRWGSCAPDGTLRFNWRVVQLSPELIDYVVVHELAHLRERNHSTRYWAHVAAVMPDHLDRRRAMREAEARLSRWP